MRDNININYKLFAIFTSILLLVCIVVIGRQMVRVKTLEKEQTTELEKIKAEKDSIIKFKIDEIDSLKVSISDKDDIISEWYKEYELLEEEKLKGKTVYIDNVKEIDSLNSSGIENYWKTEFK